jgi:hypothetical protein
VGERTDWIEWGGGDCPVEPDSLVHIKRRNGREVTRPACHLFWRHMKAAPAQDIIAYRVVTP